MPLHKVSSPHFNLFLTSICFIAKHEISYMKCQDGDETWLEMQQERNALSTTFEDSYRKRHGCPVNFI